MNAKRPPFLDELAEHLRDQPRDMHPGMRMPVYGPGRVFVGYVVMDASGQLVLEDGEPPLDAYGGAA